MTDPRVQVAYEALVGSHLVQVKTTSREFTGTVFQLFRSAYEPHITAGLVESEMGRVHFFRLTKTDCEIRRVYGR